MVLVVSEVCARGYGAGIVREERARGRERSVLRCLGERHTHGGVEVQLPAVDYVEGSDSLGYLCRYDGFRQAHSFLGDSLILRVTER